MIFNCFWRCGFVKKQGTSDTLAPARERYCVAVFIYYNRPLSEVFNFDSKGSVVVN